MKFVAITFLLNWYNLTLEEGHREHQTVRKLEKRYIRPIDVVAIKGQKTSDKYAACEVVMNDNKLHDVHGFCKDFVYKLNHRVY